MKKQLFVMIISIIFPLLTMADTYYVSTHGSDNNPGTKSEPWLSIQYAADQVRAGDTVYVESGTYSGFVINTPAIENDPIVFKALTEDVFINNADLQDNISIFMAHYVVIEGFNISNARRAGISVTGYYNDECKGVIIKNNICSNNERWGIFTGYAKDIIIENNETSYSGTEHGIYVSNSSDNPMILNNIAHHNNASGIQINADPALDGDGIISNAIVENNICYENGVNGGSALNFASIRNCIIRNNILVDNHAGGMAFWDDAYGNGMGCRDNKIYNNTVVMASDGRWALNMINTSTGNSIINNILLHKGVRGGLEIDESSMDGLLSNNNIMQKISYNENWLSLMEWIAQSGQDTNSLSFGDDELFVDNNDYHLRNGSPAIDKGQILVEVPLDFEGDKRPIGASTDIGADEILISAIDESMYYKRNDLLELLGNYPNPFNSQTVISYILHKPALVEVLIYNIQGKFINRIVKKLQSSGKYNIKCNLDNAASGLYYYTVKANNELKSGSFILIK